MAAAAASVASVACLRPAPSRHLRRQQRPAPAAAAASPVRCQQKGEEEQVDATSSSSNVTVSGRRAVLLRAAAAATAAVAVTVGTPQRAQALAEWELAEDEEGAASLLPDVGKPAPDFTLPTNAGQGEVSLRGLRGKWVVLYFYPRDFTGGCTVEANRFQRDQDKYVGLNAQVLGVSVDSVDSHRKFCDKMKLTFPLLADVKGNVSEAYGALEYYPGLPGPISARQTYLIDPKGVLRERWLRVIPGSHSQQVLDTLQKLQG